MRIAEATGRYSPIIATTNQTKPSKTGAALAGYDSAPVRQASLENATAKVGAYITPYSQALSLLFGSGDF